MEDITEDELPSLTAELMEKADSLLVVCNKKTEAEKLFRGITAGEWNIYHLSAAMCVQHRRDTVAALKKSLESGRKTLCIATQVIEAGVDISFQSVLRLTAGMDSVIQAAGRCNRNGESDTPQTVYIVNISNETLGRLKEIRQGKTATTALLDAYECAPERFANDLTSEASTRYFYEKLYSELDKDAQDYPLGKRESIFDYLSQNEKYSDADIEGAEDYYLQQAFKTAGQKFEVFDECTTDVIVPYGKGKELIADLCSARAVEDALYRDELLKAARAYTVSIYDYQKQQLERENAIYLICKDYALALSEQHYDESLGLLSEPSSLKYLEV